VLVDRLADELLAGAGLTLDDDRSVGLGDLSQPPEDRQHLGGAPPHASEAKLVARHPSLRSFLYATGQKFQVSSVDGRVAEATRAGPGCRSARCVRSCRS